MRACENACAHQTCAQKSDRAQKHARATETRAQKWARACLRARVPVFPFFVRAHFCARAFCVRVYVHAPNLSAQMHSRKTHTHEERARTGNTHAKYYVFAKKCARATTHVRKRRARATERVEEVNVGARRNTLTKKQTRFNTCVLRARWLRTHFLHVRVLCCVRLPQYCHMHFTKSCTRSAVN